jgi:hypothetical protein
MEWVNDAYQVNAADVAAAWAGRGFNLGTRRWETISGTSIGRSVETKLRIRTMQLWIYDAIDVPKFAILGHLYVVADPQSTAFEFSVRLPGPGMHSHHDLIAFIGDFPMMCGAQWRIMKGGLIDTDKVKCSIGYEHER